MLKISGLATSIEDFLNKLNKKPSTLPAPASTPLTNLVDILAVAKQPTSTLPVQVSGPAQDGSTPKDKEEHLDAVLDILNHTFTTQPTAVPTPLPAAPSVSTQINNLVDILPKQPTSTLPVQVSGPAQDGSTPKDKEEHLDAVLDILNDTITTLLKPEEKPQCEPCANNLSSLLPDKDSLINQINEWFKSVAAGFIPKQNIKESTYKLPKGKENYKYLGHFNVEQKDKPVYQKHISVNPDEYEIFVDETPINTQ